MEIKEIKKLEKNLPRYFCESCNFKCSQKCDWDRHIIRPKHLNNHNGNVEEIKKLEKTFFCGCGKNFKTNSGLWKHQKICVKLSEKNYKDEVSDKDLIMMLIKENSELRKEHSDIKELILEIIKNGVGVTNNSNNTTHMNSHNKAFNLQFFLNETCKNAMNINDFVDSIKLQLADFLEVGELGFVEGISNIIVKNLNKLDESIRPIHCTDQKRETFYVKDQDKWEKEEEDKKRIKKMIKKVAFKNENLLKNFKEAYPDYNDPNSKRSDQYSKTVIEAMGGYGGFEQVKQDKIIKNISKVTTIQRE